MKTPRTDLVSRFDDPLAARSTSADVRPGGKVMVGKRPQTRFPAMDEARKDDMSLPTAQPGHGWGKGPEAQDEAARAEEAHAFQTAMLPMSEPTEGLSSPSVGAPASGVEVVGGVQTAAMVSATSPVHLWLGVLATQAFVSSQFTSTDTGTASSDRLHDHLGKVGKPVEDANERPQTGHAGQTSTVPSNESTGQPPVPSDVPGGVGKPDDSGVPSVPGQPGGTGVPSVPGQPGGTGWPWVPGVPGYPGYPGVPSVPGQPGGTGVPQVPGQPEGGASPGTTTPTPTPTPPTGGGQAGSDAFTPSGTPPEAPGGGTGTSTDSTGATPPTTGAPAPSTPSGDGGAPAVPGETPAQPPAQPGQPSEPADSASPDAQPPTKPAEVPVYPDNQAPLPVAHEGELKISRITFAGIDPGKVPDAVRITAIQAKGMMVGTSGPLFKSTPEGPVALKPGDIIERADFDSIRWHAEDNQGGQFSFTPLSSSGKPIEASLVQTVGVSVHPEPPNYPSTIDDLQVAHDGTRDIAGSLFSGLDSTRKPAGIRITAINPRNPTDDDAPALVFGPNREKVSVNWFIHANDFDQLTWDSAHNEGGSFRFEAANADGTTLLGAVPQRVKIIEHPAPPDYPDQPTTLWAEHNTDLVLDESHFVGREAGKKPVAIRITQIEAAGGSADIGSVLSVNKPGAMRSLSVGSLVQADEFGWITWHAAANEGGRFSFEAVNANGMRILGADTHTLSIQERAALPVYQGQTTLNVEHDSRVWIGAEVFQGTDPAKAPPVIRILSVSPTGADAAQGALRLQDGSVVVENQVIRAQQFGRLQWFAQVGHGGSFQFEPVNADGSPINGASPQTVTVEEAALQPSYPGTAQTLSVEHDGMLALSATIFTGTDPGRQPAAIRVEAIQPNQPAQGAPEPLKLDRDGAGPLSPEPITAGTPVAAEHFDKLIWDASTNEGGSFRFMALDPSGREIVGVNPQTIAVHEQPAPVVDPSEDEGERMRTIIRDRTVLLGREAFLGSKEKPQVASIRIEAIEADGLLPGRSIPLLWDQRKTGSPSGAVRVKEGQILDVEALNGLYWEGTSQYRDGTIRYVLLDTNRHVLPDTDEQVLRLEEMITTAPVHLSASSRSSLPKAMVVLNGHGKIPLAQFGADDPSKAPDHVRIRWSFFRDDDEVRPSQGYSPLVLNRGSGELVPVVQDQVIRRDELDKLFWNGRYNRGGEIQYEVLDSRQQRVIGIDVQKISVAEGTLVPSIGSLGVSKEQVPDGQTIRYSESDLLGYEPYGFLAHAIRIDAIHEIDDTDQNASALVLQAVGTPGSAGYKPRQDVRVNDVVDREDISRFSWENGANRGGHFTFTPLDGLHRPVEGMSSVTHRVIEFGPVPAYQGTLSSQQSASGHGLPSTSYYVGYIRQEHEIPFNQLTKLDRSLFAGTDPGKEPHAIAVYQAPSARLNQDTSLPLLTIRRPSGEIVPVKANDRIASEDFDHLYWDATHSTVGSLYFIPVDSNGHYIHKQSDMVVAVQLRLTLGPIPLAQGTLDAPVLGHDTISRFDQDVFFNVLGLPSQADMGRKRYRFLSYTEQMEDGRKIFPYVLARGSEAKAYELVTLDAAVNKTVAARMALDKGGKLLQVENSKNKTWLDEYFFKAQGTSLDQVLHDNSDGKAQLTAFVVQYDQYKPALFHFSNDQTDHKMVWLDDYYSAGELGNFAWRSQNNQGGSIMIAEVDPAYRAVISSTTSAPATILPDTAVTVSFSEAALPGPADMGRQGKLVSLADTDVIHDSKSSEDEPSETEADVQADSVQAVASVTPSMVSQADVEVASPSARPSEYNLSADQMPVVTGPISGGSNGTDGGGQGVPLSLPMLLNAAEVPRQETGPAISLKITTPVSALSDDELWPTVMPTL